MYLYDEDRWPSGWGDGAVPLRDPSFRVKTWFSTGVFQLGSLNSRKQIDSGHFTPTEGHFAATAD